MHLLTPTGALTAWATAGLMLITFGILAGLTIGYVKQRSRDICGIIVLMDDRYQKLTPADADQAEFFAELHRYRQKLGC